MSRDPSTELKKMDVTTPDPNRYLDKANNYPLSNLYVSMLQRLGLETAKFPSSTGTMRGLEMA